MMPASDAVGVGNTFFKVENRSPDKNWDAKAYSTCALGPDMPTGTARSTKKQRLQPTEEVREMSIKTGCQQKELAIIIQNIVRKGKGWPEQGKLHPDHLRKVLHDFPDLYRNHHITYQDIADHRRKMDHYHWRLHPDGVRQRGRRVHPCTGRSHGTFAAELVGGATPSSPAYQGQCPPASLSLRDWQDEDSA
ncbi:hypothetical protein ACKKBG_A09470 [Auxenochlorella protothecoides x Auxenochlorella symbiontica]